MVSSGEATAHVQSAPTPVPRYSLRQVESMLGYFLVAPVVVSIMALIIYPMIFAIYISFTDKVVGSNGVFIGLKNYTELITHPDFQAAFVNTTVMVTFIQSIKLVIGLGLATLLNQAIRFRQFWRGLIVIPWAMPAFVAFLVWKLLYSPQGGAFNFILGSFDMQIDFLSSKQFAMPSVIAASVWRGFPFWVISFMAGMQNIPKELYEASAIDGANAWSRFLNITIPGIRHVILVVALISTILTANSFEAVWLLTGGGPSNATMTFPVLAYYGLQSLRIGEAAAVSVSMLPIFAVLALMVAVYLQKDN